MAEPGVETFIWLFIGQRGESYTSMRMTLLGTWAVDPEAGNFFREYDSWLRIDISKQSFPSCSLSRLHYSPLSHGPVPNSALSMSLLCSAPSVVPIAFPNCISRLSF